MTWLVIWLVGSLVAYGFFGRMEPARNAVEHVALVVVAAFWFLVGPVWLGAVIGAAIKHLGKKGVAR